MAINTECYIQHAIVHLVLNSKSNDRLFTSAGTWLEDGSWTSHMSEGWDPHTAKAVMDELIASFGPDK